MNSENNTIPEEKHPLADAKKELEEILLKYNIVLIPVIVHQGDKTISRIDIAPATTTD
jgi:hypothetical protein